jgi:type IV pilus assembly protein PilW
MKKGVFIMGAAMKKQETERLRNCGFTLVELLIAMVICSFLITGMVTVQKSMQKSCANQEQLSEVQQNIRASLYIIVRELRMAGYDPTGEADAAITTADSNSISFSVDTRGAAFNSDPDEDTNDPNESITYSLFDCDGDGDLDLRRQDPTVVPVNAVVPVEQMVAENVEALDFVYLDEDESVMASPVAGSDFEDIKSVQLTIVISSDRDDKGYYNDNVYVNQQGNTVFGPANDSFRRRALTTNIFCRNLGV